VILSRVLGALLVVVHAALVVIGVMGLVERFTPSQPWARISNPQFTPAMLFVQWYLFIGPGVLFVVGYLTRWHRTPYAMAVAYACMASLCAYQTFFILTNDSRFTNMIIEYLEYAVILIFLFGAPAMRERFAKAPAS
jgi:hypothetical protein